RNLHYLGRSESWCIAHLVDSPNPAQVNSQPIEGKIGTQETSEITYVLTPKKDLDMTHPLDEDHPLLVRTTDLREEMRRIDPPGSRWVRYSRPENCFEPEFQETTPKTEKVKVNVVWYLMDGKVLPPVTDVLPLGRLSRAAAMSVYGGSDNRRSTVLSGKTENGEPLKGHRHAFYLLSDEDGDDRLDHLTLYSSMGFDLKHQNALGRLTHLYGRRGKTDLKLMLLGMTVHPDGTPETPVTGKSREWRSFTPYLLTRHPKTTRKGRWKTQPLPEEIKIKTPEKLGRFPTEEHLLLKYGILPDLTEIQRDGPISQLLLSIERRDLPPVKSLKPVPEFRWNGFTKRWLEFKRYHRGVKPVSGMGYGFHITFKEPVQGPIALGYGCHYGLGLFLSISKEDGSC
ncbi:MAG: type I-U CRISPR-associated protein Csb2, partial [Thermoproteota archaeon]